MKIKQTFLLGKETECEENFAEVLAGNPIILEGLADALNMIRRNIIYSSHYVVEVDTETKEVKVTDVV